MLADPYGFCRNTACALSGPQGIHKPKPKAKAMDKPPQRSPVARQRGLEKKRRWREQQANPPAPKPAASQVDPIQAAVNTARAQVKNMIGAVVSGQGKAEIAFFLALAAQELGEHEVASLLIDKYQLGTMGLRKTV